MVSPATIVVSTLASCEKLRWQRHLSNCSTLWIGGMRTLRRRPRVVSSGDVGCKRPDPEIYEVAAQRVGADGDAVFFVDDRPLDVAAERGWVTVQFGGEPSDHRSIQGFAELPSLISAWS
jgi:beta-phosphoglucomutase-like phosphatase (HAD superfamily)